MQIRIVILLILLSVQTGVFAQDILYTYDGSTEKVLIQEIRASEVVYRKFNDPEGPTYYMPKSNIEKIVYESGIEERFGGSNETLKTNADSTQSKTVIKTIKERTTDKIVLTDGTVIEGEVVELKRFGVSYVRKGGDSNYVEYIPNTKVDYIEYADGRYEYISGTSKTASKKKAPDDFNYIPPHYVSFSIGPSLPVGNYASMVSFNPGYAEAGVDLHGEAAYYFFRGFGFSATAGFTHNGFNDLQYRTSLGNYVAQAYQGANASYKVGGWNHGYVLGGLGYFNDFGRVYIDYRVLAGALFSNYPTAQVDLVQNNENVQLRIFREMKPSFAFGTGFSIRAFITRKWSVKGGLNMLFGQALFTQMIEHKYVDGVKVGESTPSLPNSGVEQKSFTIFNLTVGIAYTLGK